MNTNVNVVFLIKAVVAVTLIAALVAFCVLNAAPVELDLLFARAETPLWIVVFAVLVIGFVLGRLPAGSRRG